MNKYKVNMTYEPFSKEPEYIQANQDFIRALDLRSSEKILDLASGTGTITKLILDIYPGVKIIVGLDISRESLLLAQMHFKDIGILNKDNFSSANSLNGNTELLLIEGTADILPFHDLSFDAVIMGNSIHLLSDEKKLLSEVYRVLKPNGIFAFNSTFYAGTMPKGTEKFHHEWVKQAMIYIKQKEEEYRSQGLQRILRKRRLTRTAFSKQWPSMNDWVNMLNDFGFEITNVYERTVMMNQRCFETIGAYAGFASVIFSGYPVHLASEALQATVKAALYAVNMEVVPRYWLEITTVRQ